LKISFPTESPFPILEGWGTSAKNKVIHLFPNCRGCYNEEFHEEAMTGLTFGFFHHSKERQVKSPTDSQVRLASLAKLTGEEQVEGYFLTVCRTQHTIVVV
jgi:hypothetical protein